MNEKASLLCANALSVTKKHRFVSNNTRNKKNMQNTNEAQTIEQPSRLAASREIVSGCQIAGIATTMSAPLAIY